jgi:hypothetical protein
MELGCFVAGVVISANGDQIVKQVNTALENSAPWNDELVGADKKKYLVYKIKG